MKCFRAEPWGAAKLDTGDRLMKEFGAEGVLYLILNVPSCFPRVTEGDFSSYSMIVSATAAFTTSAAFATTAVFTAAVVITLSLIHI